MDDLLEERVKVAKFKMAVENADSLADIRKLYDQLVSAPPPWTGTQEYMDDFIHKLDNRKIMLKSRVDRFELGNLKPVIGKMSLIEYAKRKMVEDMKKQIFDCDLIHIEQNMFDDTIEGRLLVCKI